MASPDAAMGSQKMPVRVKKHERFWRAITGFGAPGKYLYPGKAAPPCVSSDSRHPTPLTGFGSPQLKFSFFAFPMPLSRLLN